VRRGVDSAVALRVCRTGQYRLGGERVTINQLVDLVADIAGKKIGKRHIDGPQGVRGRNSDNRLIREKLGWAPSRDLRSGLEETYAWIEAQVQKTGALPVAPGSVGSA